MLTAEGAFIATVGSKGSQPLQFNYPWDVAVDHNGKVFVTEDSNNRVQVLNADLTYSHCFGAIWSCPRGITIDADGMVYVADSKTTEFRSSPPRVSCWPSSTVREKEEVG